MSNVELCGRCGDGLAGHLGRPCSNTKEDGSRCPCPFGIRTDAFLNVQMFQVINEVKELHHAMAKLVVMVSAATGIEVRDAEQGVVEAEKPLIHKV